MSAIAKLVRFGAELAAGVIEGADPNPAYIVRQLLGLGLELVPVDELRAHLDAVAAARIDTEVDAEMEAKLAGKVP